MCSESIRSNPAIETTRKGLKLPAPEVVSGPDVRPFGGNSVTANEDAAAKSNEVSAEKPAALCTPHLIRFSDSGVEGIDEATTTRGMTTAEPMRRAAVSAAADQLATDFPTFRPETAAQIERIYRGV